MWEGAGKLSLSLFYVLCVVVIVVVDFLGHRIEAAGRKERDSHVSWQSLTVFVDD